MQLFHTEQVENGIALLSGDEARHCVQVLRHRRGDSLHLVDGIGNYYEGTIAETSKKHCTVTITKTISNYNQLPYELHIGIAPTKNISRFEWFLEKATEIGISTITPLDCQQSERHRLRPDRLQKVLRAAMKQSIKAYLPILNPLQSFSSFIQQAVEPTTQRYIAHCQQANLPLLQHNYSPPTPVIILIGPEGDFTEQEINDATAHHFQSISLGNSRLRTETAGIVACHTIYSMNVSEWGG